jgi:hypothetical protein
MTPISEEYARKWQLIRKQNIFVPLFKDISLYVVCVVTWVDPRTITGKRLESFSGASKCHSKHKFSSTSCDIYQSIQNEKEK